MKAKKLVLDTQKPLGNPNGLKMATGATLLLSIAVEYKVAPQIISTGNFTALAYPFLINIIPLGYNVGSGLISILLIIRSISN